MIEIVLNKRCVNKLRRELRRAGSNEIGGILAGQNIGDGRFLVLDLSVQRDGSFSHFRRSSPKHHRFMRQFFDHTGHDYQRFNYLGEWHSHPSFPALPSKTDFSQMQKLIEERDQNAQFLVLLVVKMPKSIIEASAYAFRRCQPPLRIGLSSTETGNITDPASYWEKQQKYGKVFERNGRACLKKTLNVLERFVK